MEDRPDPAPEVRPGGGSEFAGAPEISRRVAAILDAVEREAQRQREEARAEAERYLEEARLRADGLVAERRRRIAAVSDELLAKAEAVVGRLDDAAPVREGFESLVRALAVAAERLARETDGGPPPPPAQPSEHASGRRFGGQPHPARAPSAPESWRTGP